LSNGPCNSPINYIIERSRYHANEACPDPDIQAHEIFQDDQRADAAFDEAFPETFWDEPEDNVVQFENTQTITDDKILTARQVALELFKNCSKEAMEILYSKKMRRKLGASQRGKGCKAFSLKARFWPTKLNSLNVQLGWQCTFQNMLWTDPQTKGPMLKGEKHSYGNYM
jgi:hypothetical protein